VGVGEGPAFGGFMDGAGEVAFRASIKSGARSCLYSSNRKPGVSAPSARGSSSISRMRSTTAATPGIDAKSSTIRSCRKSRTHSRTRSVSAPSPQPETSQAFGVSLPGRNVSYRSRSSGSQRGGEVERADLLRVDGDAALEGAEHEDALPDAHAHRFEYPLLPPLAHAAPPISR
jgi:hypothetical protein